MLYAPREIYTSVLGDGSSTSLTANPVGLSLSSGMRLAFGCWVWLNSIAADDYRQIMSLNDGEAIGAGANIDGIDFIRPGGGSNYSISLYSVRDDSSDEYQSNTISLNTWYHLFWQRISNTQLQLWINGRLDGTVTHTAISTHETPSRLDMIGVWDTLTEPMNGRIANAKCWWNRTLTAGQIKQEMHSTEPVIADSTLWAWYPFPQGRGRYLDHSGRGHHITQTRGNPGTGPAPTHKLIAPVYKRRLFVLPWATSGGATQYPLTVSGAITPAATLINRTAKALAGSAATSGTLTKRASKTMAAGITPAATLINRIGKALSADIAISGTLTKRTSKTFAGSVTPTGAASFIRTVLLAVSGAIASAGTLTKRTATTFVSSITTSGTLTKQTAKTFAGSIASSGALTMIRTFLIALSGAIASAGALTKRAGKALSADIATSGALTKRTAKAFAGSIASSATLASIRTVLLSLAGSIAPSGALTKRTATAFSGAITSAGTLTKRISVAVSGVIATIGALITQLIVQTVTATESMAMREEPTMRMRDDTNMVMR